MVSERGVSRTSARRAPVRCVTARVEPRDKECHLNDPQRAAGRVCAKRKTVISGPDVVFNRRRRRATGTLTADKR